MALTEGVEVGAEIRAAVVDMQEKLDLRNWEQSSAMKMGHVWMTDCDPLYEHLISPKNSSVDNKRLAVDRLSDNWYGKEEENAFSTSNTIVEIIPDGLTLQR